MCHLEEMLAPEVVKGLRSRFPEMDLRDHNAQRAKREKAKRDHMAKKAVFEAMARLERERVL